MNKNDEDNFKFCLGLMGVMIFGIVVFDIVPYLILPFIK